MRRVFRFLVIHVAFRDRCPVCYGAGIRRHGWRSLPDCPDCRGSGFICWRCGKPMQALSSESFFRYRCRHCTGRSLRQP